MGFKPTIYPTSNRLLYSLSYWPTFTHSWGKTPRLLAAILSLGTFLLYYFVLFQLLLVNVISVNPLFIITKLIDKSKQEFPITLSHIE
jgi:hypothetical protein